MSCKKPTNRQHCAHVRVDKRSAERNFAPRTITEKEAAQSAGSSAARPGPGGGKQHSSVQVNGELVRSSVDDLGLMLAAATPRALMKKLPASLDSLGKHCERHGLRVNYQPGKTEIMLHPKIVADGNKIHTPGGLHLRVVNRYVHIGSTTGDDNADVERGACMQSYVPNAQCFWELLLQGERSSQFCQILVFFPPSVQRSRLVFFVTMGSSKTQWLIHEGAPKGCGAAKIQNRTVDRRESPRVHISQNWLCYLVQLAKGRADTLSDLVQLWTDRHHMLVPWPPDRQCDGLGRTHYTVPSPVEATGAQLDSQAISLG